MIKKTIWAPMPPSKRAKQFAPFQALKGLNEAIANKEKVTTPRRELTEESIAEINRVLINLASGSLVTAVYYCDFEQEYRQLTGYVKRVDPLCKCLQIGNVSIDFRDLSSLWPYTDSVRSILGRTFVIRKNINITGWC